MAVSFIRVEVFTASVRLTVQGWNRMGRFMWKWDESIRGDRTTAPTGLIRRENKVDKLDSANIS